MNDKNRFNLVPRINCAYFFEKLANAEKTAVFTSDRNNEIRNCFNATSCSGKLIT